MKIKIEIVPKLIILFSTNKRYLDIYGGRGSGKSWGVALFLLSKGMESRKRILCTREIQTTIKDSVHKLLSDQIEQLNLSWFYIIKKDSITGINGTEFIFKGLYRNENDIKSTEGIDYCWVEEAQSVSRDSLKTLTPTIRNPGSQIIFTYNPTNDDDPVHVDYTLADRPDTLKIECNYQDNPWFPEVLRDEMEYDRANDIDKYHHVWCGKTVKHSQAQIFYGKWKIQDFDIPEDVFFYQGADWGFAEDPLAAIRFFIQDNILYISHEVYGFHVELDDIPAKLREIPEFHLWPTRGDSSRPDTISYVSKRGFPLLEPAHKGPNSIVDGIAHLRSYRCIVIHPRCKHTADEFRLYSYVIDKKTGVISNKIEDKHNHIIDSLRYAAEPLSGDREVTEMAIAIA